MGISLALLGGDFVDEGPLVGNAAVEALSGQNAEFGFGQIKPTAVLGRVMPFEALDQAPFHGAFIRRPRVATRRGKPTLLSEKSKCEIIVA
jgi:hypothetical protein